MNQSPSARVCTKKEMYCILCTGGSGRYIINIYRTRPPPPPIKPSLQNNLEINSDMKSAKDTLPVHKKLQGTNPVDYLSKYRDYGVYSIN